MWLVTHITQLQSTELVHGDTWALDHTEVCPHSNLNSIPTSCVTWVGYMTLWCLSILFWKNKDNDGIYFITCQEDHINLHIKSPQPSCRINHEGNAHPSWVLGDGWVVRKESGGALETPGHLVPFQFHPRASLPIPETVTLFFFMSSKSSICKVPGTKIEDMAFHN